MDHKHTISFHVFPWYILDPMENQETNCDFLLSIEVDYQTLAHSSAKII